MTPRKCFTLAVALLISHVAFAQTTLDGMARVAEWTDLETTSDEMPSQIWGTCDADGADRIGIRVEFDDGTSGTATYSGVSGVWNTANFPNIDPDSASGFFDSPSCQGIHFLFNSTASLPLAWNSCSMAYSSNFDLDYSEQNGSQFRASTTGWVSAHFQTYCGNATAVISAPESIPVVPVAGLVVLGVLLPLAGVLGLRARGRRSV